MSRSNNKRSGFTLIEVLIALAILAIALAATARAASTATNTAIEAKKRTLAMWVAQNRIAEVTARREFPGAGTNTGSAEMGGLLFTWTQRNAETPNPVFRKVVVEVREANDADRGGDARTIASLSTYVMKVTP